jgi:1-acyl-sn-glycerol-3-phosphate acyltransferase
MIVLSTAAFIVTIFDKSGDGAHHCGRLWARGILGLAGIRVKISGIEHLDLNKPQILATNHQGTFDIFVLLAVLPVQFRWVVKKELFRIPFMGMAMRQAGYIPIDREHSRQALRDLKEAGTHLKTGRSVVIFPEGTRTRTGKLGRFKRGIMLLATFSENPVVPVSIKGTFSIMKKGGFLICPGPVWVVVHPQIPVSGLSGKEQKELSEQVRQIIAKDLEKS